MTTIHIEIDDTTLRATLQRAHERLSNPRPLMAGIANLMLEAVEDNFAQERDPETDAKWPALAASTKRQREETGHTGKILQVSGSLASSISSSYGDDFAMVGTNKAYAPVHQFGSRSYKIRPRNKKALAFGGIVVRSVNHPGVPARPFLGLSPQAKQDIIEAAEGYVAQAFNP